MSDSPSVSRQTSQIRAATYNVMRSTRRRVKWLAELDEKNRVTHADNLEHLGDKSNLCDTVDNLTSQPYPETHLESVEKYTQPKPPILPKKYSDAVNQNKKLYNTLDRKESTTISESCSQLDELTKSSDDTKSSSESLNILQRESTFTIADTSASSGFISPSEDLRRRKVIALAKANARHASKSWNDRYFYSEARESKKQLVARNRIRANQPRFRAYIESTGMEAKNDSGEKIYFHWEERYSSEVSKFSRVPHGVRKLQEYKRKRFRNKYNGNGSSKSAPNKLEGGNISAEQSDKINRGKTADLVSNVQETILNNISFLKKGARSLSKTKVKMRVAFGVTTNNSSKGEIINVKKESRQDIINKKEYCKHDTQVNNKREENGDGEIEKFSKSYLPDIVDLSNSSTSNAKELLVAQHAKTSTKKRDPATSLLSSKSSPADNNMHNTSTIYKETNNNMLSEPKSKIFHQQSEQDVGSTEININNQINNNHNSNTTSEIEGNVLELNPLGDTTRTDQIQSESNFNSAQESKHVNYQFTNRRQSHALQNSNGVTYLPNLIKHRQYVIRNSITNASEQSLENWESQNKRDKSSECDTLQQHNEPLQLDRCLSIDGGVLNVIGYSGTAEHKETNIYENYNNNDRTQELEQTSVKTDSTTNANLENSFEQRNIEQEFRTNFTQKERNALNSVKRQNKPSFSHEIGMTRCQGDMVNRESSENISKREENINRRTDYSNCGITYSRKTVNEQRKENLKQKKSKGSVEEHSNVGKSEQISNNRSIIRKEQIGGEVGDTQVTNFVDKKNTDLGSEGDTLGHNVHVLERAELGFRDVDQECSPHFDQTNDGDRVSNKVIDHNFVEKSVSSCSDNVARDSAVQFQHVPCGQSEQCRVIELKHGNEVERVTGLEKSLQDVGVSTATAKLNKYMTAIDNKRKLTIHMKNSLSSLPDSRNNWSPEKNETGHKELIRNDLSQRVVDIEKEHFVEQEGYFSSPSPGENSTNTHVIRNSSNQEAPNKQVDHVRHDHQSITNGTTKEMLKLEFVELKKDDGLTVSTLPTNRYKNGSDLPQGEWHLHNRVQQKRIGSGNDVMTRQSKTIENLPIFKKEETKIIEYQEMETNIGAVNSRSGDEMALNVVGATNSVSKFIHNDTVNSDSREDTSIECYESTNETEITSEQIRLGVISNSDPAGCSTLEDREYISQDSERNGKHFSNDLCRRDNLLDSGGNCDKSMCSKKNVIIFKEDSVRTRSMTIQPHNNLALKDEQNLRRNQSKCVQNINAQRKDISENKRNQQSKKIHIRERSKKRQILNLHTQNMEFEDLPKKYGTSFTSSTLPQAQIYSVQHNKLSQNVSALKEANRSDIQEDVITQRNGMNYSEVIFQTELRPKTAGRSAYSKHQNEELWSVNTDDDEDDQIQFIEGEQDFYKVFGYNEETAAILNATKVYTVAGSVDTPFGAKEHNPHFSETTHYFYDGVPEREYSPNSENINGIRKDTVSSYYGDVASGKVIDESNEVKRNDQIHDRNEEMKMHKLDNGFTSNPVKSLDKHISHYSQETFTNIQQNIYRVNKTNHLELENVQQSDESPFLINHLIADRGYHNNDTLTDEVSSQREENGVSYLQTHNESSRRLASIVLVNEGTDERQEDFVEVGKKESNFSDTNILHSHYQPSTETVKRLGNSQDGTDYKTRRRIHSEADILKPSIDIAQTLQDMDYHSDGYLKIPQENMSSIRDSLIPIRKDSKSHILLRNQLATERHIHQNRYHRHISNNLHQYRKGNVLQLSPITEPRTSKHTDKTNLRQLKNNDSNKPAHLRKPDTSLQEQILGNTYLQIADRIMSRISDTEKSIYNRLDPSSVTTQNKFQETLKDESLTNSSLRRMSHPVDSRIKHSPKSNSYFVARPRKLEPILQVPGVRQNKK